MGSEKVQGELREEAVPVNRPIGVFDSGVGGLTVVRQIFSKLPGEEIVYFGDSARVPYGPKSREVITRFGLQAAEFLCSKRVKLIVVACNSVSSNSLEALKDRFDVPVMGVIRPGAEAGCRMTRNRKIGVIGTTATIESGAYQAAIGDMALNMEVYTRSCPLFVPLAEEGWMGKKAAFLIAEEYLGPLKSRGVDTLILGCTHYPLLKQTISEVMGEGVVLVDSAEVVAMKVEGLLSDRGLLKQGNSSPRHQFYLSDIPRKFPEIGERFLGQPIPAIVTVNLDEEL